ncbi:CoA-binding protein [Fulvitalea axinellae]|uniref:CoA-binding protein n=1 Tax=Fulvitalea axinellae TaxID=1182444 RepID=A0AAU9DG08_9BACT|nr:CoA-binding protein [Fulvitalea axinellae]
MKKDKTLVIGASTNPERYSFKAANMLAEYGCPFVLSGLREGTVAGSPIHDIRKREMFEGIDTVTLYVGPKNQAELEEYIISLKPRRVIFNPGTESPDFQKKLETSGIEVQEACTLVLLRTGQY